MVIQSINPATGKILKEFKESKKEKINNQIDKSVNIFELWREKTFSERSKLLRKTAHILRNNKKEYSSIMTLEMGKPIAQAEAEIEKCAWVCEFYADNGEKFLEKETVDTDADKSFVAFRPLGVILGIMPWNFPFWQVFRWAVPAIMAGNVCVLKHSSNVPQCALAIEKIFKKAGFLENTFKTLLVSSNKISEIIKDDRIAAVSLTGSTEAGSDTAKNAGKNLKKTVLELGGSDPFIVLEDANLDYSTDKAVDARMINTGQSCIAAKRFIVLKDVFDDFKNILVKKINKLKVGDPKDINTDIGPLARLDILEQIDSQVKKSVEKGADILTGGKILKSSGFFYSPTIISNVKKGMPVYEEETFGPVATIINVNDEKEAIKTANDTCYGLGASIWTEDVRKGQRLAKYLEAGNVFVNEMVKSDPRLPFGGIKKSGYGRELSHYGIKEFVNIQTIYMKKI